MFTGGNCFCCTPIDPPPVPQYAYSYYYRRGHKVSGCWGCPDLTLPDTIYCTVVNTGPACDCLTSGNTYALTWVPSFDLISHNGNTYTITGPDGLGGGFPNVGMWISQEIPNLCKSSYTGTCDLWQINRIVVPAGYLYDQTQGSLVQTGKCRLTVFGWLNKNYISWPAYFSYGGDYFAATSCSPLLMTWQMPQPFDIEDPILPIVVTSCNHGCPVAATPDHWTYTVTA